MTDINNVTLVGRITKDFDERTFGYTNGGTARATVSIAVNRSRKDANGNWNDTVSYFDVQIWGKTAENLKSYLTKGKQIIVTGYLDQQRWTGNDGQNHSRVIVVSENIQLAGGRQEGNAANVNNGQQQYQQPAQQTYQPQHQNVAQQAYQPQGFDGQDFNEDYPF